MNGPIAHGGAIGAAVARFGGRPCDWLDLSTGLNPCPPPLPAIPDRIFHRLPDQDLFDAAEAAAARFYGAGEVRPLAVAGTQAAIQQLSGLVASGARVAILGPTYGEYRRAFQAAGHVIDDMASLDEIDARHALAVVVNPNNPDGRLHRRADLLALAGRLAASGGRLVVDEAFADCLPDESLSADVAGTPNLIVLRSFGKFFGLAGIRLGFVLAEEATRATLAERLGPWSVAGPALALATSLFALGRARIAAKIAERSEAQARILRQAGLTVVGQTPLFSLIAHDRAGDLHRHLCGAFILTRAFDYAPSWLRFGLSPDAAGDARLVTALVSFGAAR